MDKDTEYIALQGLIISNTFVSFISCFFNILNIIIHLFYIKRKSYVFELGIYFSIAELLYSIAQVISFFRIFSPGFEIEPKSALCFIQSSLIDYANFSSMIWLSYMTYSVYVLLTKNDKSFMNKGRTKFLLIGFVTPIIFTIIPMFIKIYDPVTTPSKTLVTFCWITNQSDDNVYVIIIYIIYWSFLLFCFIIRKKVVNFLKNFLKMSNSGLSTSVENMISRLRYYPIVLFICWFFATIQRFYTNFVYFGYKENEQPDSVILVYFILDALHTTLMCGRGFLLFLVYVKTNNFREEMNEICSFCCCKTSETKIKKRDSIKTIITIQEPLNI